MKGRMMFNTLTLALAIGVGLANMAAPVQASGGSSGGGGAVSNVDAIKVTKCFYDAPTHAMLIKASSSKPFARLFAYLPSGKYIGEVQNGGGSRYGGTVMGYIAGGDPRYVIIRSNAGGVILAPTTPFQI
jgi:hypothetical protein